MTDDWQRRFYGRTAVLVSLHHKAPLVAPAFERVLNMKLVAYDAIDTDQFGSFSRTVPRRGSARDAARSKAHAAFFDTRFRYVIASEGSFGPHPLVPFVACGREMLVFWDAHEDWEAWESELTHETNYGSADVQSIEEASAFARRVGFPSHALMIRSIDDKLLRKGVIDEAELRGVVENELLRAPSVTLETDMRAHLNPTRQQSIRRVSWQLADRLKSQCPRCKTPGFGMTSVKPGLPCEACRAPTQQPSAVCCRCERCEFEEERPTEGELKAPAGLCDLCNP